MERPRPSTIAWGAILGGVALFELLTPNGETLSDRVDTVLEGKYKYLALGAIGITAAHLANVLPESADPFEQGLSRIRQLAQRKMV